MQGVFLDALERFVELELGRAELSRLRGLIGRGDQGYAFDTSYPDDHITLMVQGVSEATGRPPDEILEQFAEGLVPSLLDVYGFAIDQSWTLMDFLINTERVIHKAVRLNSRSARPPAIGVKRIGPDSVVITYRSERRLCSVAKGIIRGAATHYRVQVALREECCMLRGDAECVITVSTLD